MTPESALALAIACLIFMASPGPGVMGLLARALAGRDDAFALGKRAAQRYFFAYELPKIDAWLGVVARREAVCRAMRPEWF